jgi:hypothetical protein
LIILPPLVVEFPQFPNADSSALILINNFRELRGVLSKYHSSRKRRFTIGRLSGPAGRSSEQQIPSLAREVYLDTSINIYREYNFKSFLARYLKTKSGQPA